MRVTCGVARHARKKRILKAVKGQWGRRHNLTRLSIEAMHTADKYRFVGRKRRKRDFRRLWITRLSAACRALGINYSRFIAGLAKAQVQMDRKALSNLAITAPEAFKAVVEKAKAALAPA